MKVCKMKVALIVLLVSCTVGAWGNNNNNGNNNNGNNGNNGNHNNLNIWVPGGDTYHYCRGQIYDPYSQMCCGGAVHSKQPWIRCCVDTKWAESTRRHTAHSRTSASTVQCGITS